MLKLVMLLYSWPILWVISSVDLLKNELFRGCYEGRSSSHDKIVTRFTEIEQCIQECGQTYYRYSLLTYDKNCFCDNYLGTEYNATMLCNEVCPDCEIKDKLSDVYSTGIVVPGPPQDVQIMNITDESIKIIWKQPQSFTKITGYSITAIVNHSFVNYIPNSLEWTYTNDTFATKLLLLPATVYNISLRAISPEGEGTPRSQFIETLIGEPENLPDPPTIIKNVGDKVEIRVKPVSNGNGPISSYLIVVFEEDYAHFFQESSLVPYAQAKKDGYTYYITAKLQPIMIEKNFIIGDGHTYNGYYNAPLTYGISYKFKTGIVSELHGQVKTVFSTTENLNFEINTNDGMSAVTIGLFISIGVFSFMLITAILMLLILKNRIAQRRGRLSENQELTLQGPVIEVENNGYISDDEQSTKEQYYQMLKQKIRSFSYNQMNIAANSFLGIGLFGKVNSASLYENNFLTPIAAYSIHDKKLSNYKKKHMLKDLDVLIKGGRHDNVIALIGTCETEQILVVALEYISLNLKELLLNSRSLLNNKFSNLAESQVLNIAADIARGMAHLEKNKIIHKQLCARNIFMGNTFVPKISGFGLAQYYDHNNVPNYTRWTSVEVFKGYSLNVKTDVWSFACLLWEICVLGGTLYNHLSNDEIPEQIIKGLRLPQKSYFTDELYQVMLDCWQIDRDERPNFNSLINVLDNMQHCPPFTYLNFNMAPNFQYEQFFSDMEI